MAKNEKKVLLFIVEGTSDEVSFESILDSFFDIFDVHVAVMHCDITVQNFPSPGEIKGKLFEQVESYCRVEKIRLPDLEKIIHLIDTDSAFIPASNIMQQLPGQELSYTKSQIVAPVPANIKMRNEVKAAVLGKLCSMKVLANTPYEVYYLSRTLEHVLHNRIENLSDREKEEYSNAFDDRYAEDLPGFLAFISDNTFAVSGDYKQTWDFIKQGTHSLQRYSNLHLLFDTAYSRQKDF